MDMQRIGVIIIFMYVSVECVCIYRYERMHVCMHVRGFIIITFHTVTKSDFNLEHFLPAPRLGHRGNSGFFFFKDLQRCVFEFTISAGELCFFFDF